MNLKKKEHTFTVRGKWPFPTEMLKYDEARPASPEDGMAVDRMSGNCKPDDAGPVSVTLVTEGWPTQGRWASYGWRVVLISTDGDRNV